ncbi:Protein of unknown function, partial [Gryllus bimaculatus]
ASPPPPAAASPPPPPPASAGETLERVNEQLHRTTQRLVDLRSQNMQLRHDLMLAKKSVLASINPVDMESCNNKPGGPSL